MGRTGVDWKWMWAAGQRMCEREFQRSVAGMLLETVDAERMFGRWGAESDANLVGGEKSGPGRHEHR